RSPPRPSLFPYTTLFRSLTVVIPKLEQWQKQGEVGIKKITQWTRYMTVTLAILQSTGLVFLFNNQFSVAAGLPANIIPPENFDRSEEHTSELQSLAYLVC